MKEKLAIAFPLFFLSFQIWTQDNPQSVDLTTRLETYLNNRTPEKTYLHTDKDLYTHGDTLWFKAYLLNGTTHSVSDINRVIYVELWDSRDSLVVQRKLYIDGTSASGDIKIDDSIGEGDYYLRTYTMHMLNDKNPALFQKKISILARPLPINNLLDDTITIAKGKEIEVKDTLHPTIERPNVQFFPEGGNLVAGLQSGLGLKITDVSGNGIALRGTIIDQNGVVAARFETHDFGLGIVPFTARMDMDYVAEINLNGIPYSYRLPRALDNGYVIQLKNKGTQLIIKVSTNIGQGLKGTLLLGHLRGDTFLKHSKEEVGKNSYTLKIPTADLSDGVAHFTLFDQQGEPVCERLAFIDNPKNRIDLTLKTDRSEYGPRERAGVDMSLFDAHGKPLEGDFSMSISLDKGLEKNAPNIKSWLLLNSDIGHTVENPYYFFDDDSHKRKGLLDILMLAHGWRRFVWKPFMEDSKELQPEKGIMINGRTTSFKNSNLPQRAKVVLNILGQDIYQEELQTDNQGKFSFGPLIFMDSVQAVITASALEQAKKDNVKIAVHIDPSPSKINIGFPIRHKSQKKNVLPQNELIREYRNIVNDLIYAPDAIPLSEVVVQARKKTKKERIEEELNKMTLHGTAQNRLFPDSTHGLTPSASVFDLIRRVAGVHVTGTNPNQMVSIRGISSISGLSTPLFTIDGVPVSIGFVQNLTVNDVLFVDVLKGNEAAIYGVRGANGVVAIYTDRGRNYEEPQDEYPGITNFIVHGFYRAREFYILNYSVDRPEHQLPDYRTTLYWDPEVVINGEIPTKLNFYTGDVAGKYTAKVEGITKDGRPVSGQYSFYVSD